MEPSWGLAWPTFDASQSGMMEFSFNAIPMMPCS